VQVPTGSVVLGIIDGEVRSLVVRGDLAQPNTTYNFVVVRSDVTLQAQEEAAVYVGSVTGYRTPAGLELYHILRLP
jgi:multidrug efflux pump subunit AcrA (membrane-fusion protein)